MTVTDSAALNNHKIGFYELLIQANSLPTFILYPSGTTTTFLVITIMIIVRCILDFLIIVH